MSYRHLTPFERARVEVLRKQAYGCQAIARELGRAPSTISRELRRNTKAGADYCAEHAQARYQANRQACVRTQVLDYAPLRDYVRDKLSDEDSPEQISGRLARDFAHNGRMRVSPEAIYRRIYADPKWYRAFCECLRQGRKTRQKRGGTYQSRGAIANKVSIDERPEEVDALESYGHWEGDTIVGKNQQGAIVTLVERKGDWLRAIPVASRNADEVAKAILEAFKDVPPELVKTITFDNGSEFARHEYLAQQLDADIYFAHPYSPWERARNENMNGLIRQYLPKGTSFAGLARRAVSSIVNALNNRPRKKQQFRTPNEVFQQQCVALEV